MRLVLCDVDMTVRSGFYPLSYSRPIWELRYGMTTLGEKLVAKTNATDVAGFVPDYMGDSFGAKTDWAINDPKSLTGDDLLLVAAQVKAEGFDVDASGASEVGVDGEGNVLYARVTKEDAGKLSAKDAQGFLDSARASLPNVTCSLATWKYTWELVLTNPEQLPKDFAEAGRSGIEGTVEQPNAIRGSEKDVYVGPGTVIHPMAVLDAENGPIYLDEDVEVHPFTRIEGPCYIGKKTIMFGTKCREGNTIGPVCRVGGEVEESIMHGHSNKYHDGFLGHAYVGEWVNLGALTTNSDLKNDYSSVSVILDGRRPIDTGSTKVGSLIGDHTKTSIGTLLNTGSVVGAMALIMATGAPLQKFIPSFAWLLNGNVTKGFGKGKLYETARVSMSRRKKEWTPAEEAMWDSVFEITAPERTKAIQLARRKMFKKS